MAIRDWFKKAPLLRRFYPINSWVTPPDRDAKGYLSAYSEIYSLFGVVLRIATAMSEVRWRLYKGNERSERSQVAIHPILKLLDFANEFQTGQEIIELTSLHMDLAGRAYWYLPRNGLGVPGEVWVLPPHLMKPIPSKKDFIKGYLYQNGTEVIPFDKSEIIRFPMPDPMNPYGGIGYVQPASVELDSESYAGEWNRNFFFNSARADAVLETDGKLSNEQYEELKRQWNSQHQGVSRAHKIAILEGGLQYKQIQLSQKDMDFPNLRRQTRENLLFTFGMPLSVMGISENVNRANAEAGDYTFARWLIKPRLTRILNKLNEQLLPMFPQAKGIELDFDEIVPETIEQKKGLAESGVKAGYMLINEGRKLTGLDPLPPEIGDQLLIPMNMILTPVGGRKLLPAKTSGGKESKGLSDEQKEIIWRAFATTTEKQEVLFIKALKGLFNNQEAETIKQLENTGTLDGSLFDTEKTRDKFVDTFKPLIELVYLFHKEAIMADETPTNPHKMQKQAEFLDSHALEWIAERSLSMTATINTTTKIEIRKQLAQGFMEGESIPELTKRIEGYFSEAFKRRAPMIARTEVISASAEGAVEGYKDLGLGRLEFFPAPDACVICEALVGEYPLDETHGVITGQTHPNCRCIWLPVIE